MSQQREIIQRGLEEFVQHRARQPDGWLTFEANSKEHWLQCARDVINMDWPFEEPPQESQLQDYFGAVGPLQIEAWDRDGFVTFKIAQWQIEPLVAAIERVFRDLYDLGSNYDLIYKLEGNR